MRRVLWSIDSLVWADSSAPPIVKRVMERPKVAGRGIVLMQDIHAHSAEAPSLLIESLRAPGYRFARRDGQGLSLSPACSWN